MAKSTKWIKSDEFVKRAIATYGYAVAGAILFWVPVCIVLGFLSAILDSGY